MTSFVLGDYFDPLRSRLLPALIDARSFNDIRVFSDRIPGSISSFFGFECPVSTPLRTADLLFCSTQLEGHSRILAGLHNNICLPQELLSLPAWQRTRQFCIAWEEPDSQLFQQLLNIWLEFDIGQSDPPYSPSLFFGTTPESHRQPERLAGTISEALQQLAPEALEAKRGETLRRVLTAVRNAGAHVFQVGVMLSRQLPAIRVCIRGIPVSEIIPVLQACGWFYDTSELSTVVDKFSERCARVDVDIDVGEVIGKKIGLECYFGRDQKTLVRVKDFLELMISENLIDSDRAQALYEFNGLVCQDSNPGLWCNHLLRMAALQGIDVVNLLACWLHHVKLVYEIGSPLSAKAYLGVQADRMSRQTLRSRLCAVGNA